MGTNAGTQSRAVDTARGPLPASRTAWRLTRWAVKRSRVEGRARSQRVRHREAERLLRALRVRLNYTDGLCLRAVIPEGLARLLAR